MSELLRTQAGDVISLFDEFIKPITGILGFGMNELNLRSLVDDPPKYVLEGVGDVLGAWSARRVLPNGSVVELALIQFKKDERTRGRDDVMYGEWTIHIKGPATERNPDGMILVFLALHDYVWIRGISATPDPQPPVLTLPPPPPPAPVDDWLLPENQRKHLAELHRIETEMGFPMDSSRFDAYMTGRNRNLTEVHDDELNRAGVSPDPCEGKNKVPLP